MLACLPPSSGNVYKPVITDRCIQTCIRCFNKRPQLTLNHCTSSSSFSRPAASCHPSATLTRFPAPSQYLPSTTAIVTVQRCQSAAASVQVQVVQSAISCAFNIIWPTQDLPPPAAPRRTGHALSNNPLTLQRIQNAATQAGHQ